MLKLLLSTVVTATTALACADHYIIRQPNGLYKRAEVTREWAYEASFNWGQLSPDYVLCQAGTMQSPIQLFLSQGLSLHHIPTFDYAKPVSGHLYNWGYGPAFIVDHDEHDFTTAPSMTYDDITTYLKSWHIHSPADHSVQGDRSKSELHLVMVDSEGSDRAVLAIRIDPGNAPSAFFSQLPQVPSFNDSSTVHVTGLDMQLALTEVAMFGEFWTYKGSLTSPPCTEGLRFFVARNILFVSVEQMQAILRVSTYSARVEQEVWLHEINV